MIIRRAQRGQFLELGYVYEGGLGALVSEIREASNSNAQADAKTPGVSIDRAISQ
jgi:hypothetical protein